MAKESKSGSKHILANMPGGWEAFFVTYRLPKFGSEGEFMDQTHEMIVATKGGRKDARAACEKYHKGCKIESVLTVLESVCDDKGDVTRAIKKTEKINKKNG